MELGAWPRRAARHAKAAAAVALGDSRGTARSAVAGLAARPGMGPATLVRHPSRAGARVGNRRGLRSRRRMAGEVPSTRGADPGRRGRACRVPHLRLVLRSGSRADAASRGNRDRGAASPRPALASEAHPVCLDRGRRARSAAAAAARSGARGGVGGGPRRHRLRRNDPAASRQHHLALLHGARLSAGRRHQRGQRDHRGC
jgi:hypothetical protein